MRTVSQTIQKSFPFVGTAQAAEEIEHCVVILQILKAITNLRWITFVGFGISVVHLIQNGFTIAATQIKGMVFKVSIQGMCNVLHIYLFLSLPKSATPDTKVKNVPTAGRV